MLLAEKFHILSHIFISLIGSILLIALWYNIRSRFKKLLAEEEGLNRVDKGLAYLSMAIFIWVLSGIWSFLAGNFALQEALVHAIRSLLSTVNNLFLLLALFYFHQSPRFIYKNSKNVKRITLGIIGLSLFSMGLFQKFGYQSFNGIIVSFIPDLMLSAFSCYLMLVSFYKTFMLRELKVVAFLSVFLITILFYSQLPEVFSNMNDDFENNLMKIIAKTSLISIFLVLATNWVMQLAQTPKPSEMSLQFLDWSLVNLSVPSKGIHQKTIDFKGKTTQFKNLLKFAIRRKAGKGEEQYIEIGKGGEILRQTYLSRIIDNINQILPGEENEQLERNDLFTFVGQGKYRLRMIPKNITIDQTLLKEFTNDTDNQDYRQFVTFCNSKT
ncbi:hypothetical protein [Xanthovirga aplysinae]|uniref:hypothetical protein n=1 Tax=Xanthovirga aplysinae TaxID=2529853 RepID=UPI0012BB5B48|nr:hypothetical protein [Xanthovirga aplysinae]MTI31223.1 hypothetical protein [Xanthovirga aplysinae]